MTVAETLLVFVGAPLAVVVLLALLTYLPGGRRRPRWKSGQPWQHAPVWYEPHPDGPAGGAGSGHGETKAIGSSVYPERHGDAADGHGAATDGATAAPQPVPGGPLGGARGTW